MCHYQETPKQKVTHVEEGSTPVGTGGFAIETFIDSDGSTAHIQKKDWGYIFYDTL